MGNGLLGRGVYQPGWSLAVRVSLVRGSWCRHGLNDVCRWAWQHTDDSRHVEDVLLDKKTATGKNAPKRRRTRRSLKAHLEDLHALLRSAYFAPWPLRVRFFAADVHRTWKAWYDRVDECLPGHMVVILDGDSLLPGQTEDRGSEAVGSVHGLQVNYAKFEDYLEKAAFLLDDPADLCCRICQGRTIPSEELVVVCPQAQCHCISHMVCLSARFLEAAGDPDRFVPLHGICPACEQRVQWPVIMQELTLRRRGDREVQTILRRKKKREDRQRKAENAKGIQKDKAEPVHEQDSSDEPNDNLDENWVEDLASESESDTETSKPASTDPTPSRLEIVIEDSEDE